jgi:hypothetical protein
LWPLTATDGSVNKNRVVYPVLQSEICFYLKEYTHARIAHFLHV